MGAHAALHLCFLYLIKCSPTDLDTPNDRHFHHDQRYPNKLISKATANFIRKCPHRALEHHLRPLLHATHDDGKPTANPTMPVGLSRWASLLGQRWPAGPPKHHCKAGQHSSFDSMMASCSRLCSGAPLPPGCGFKNQTEEALLSLLSGKRVWFHGDSTVTIMLNYLHQLLLKHDADTPRLNGEKLRLHQRRGADSQMRGGWCHSTEFWLNDTGCWFPTASTRRPSDQSNMAVASSLDAAGTEHVGRTVPLSLATEHPVHYSVSWALRNRHVKKPGAIFWPKSLRNLPPPMPARARKP